MISSRTKTIVLRMLTQERDNARDEAAHLSHMAAREGTAQSPRVGKLRKQNAILGKAIAEIEALTVKDAHALPAFDGLVTP